MSVFSENNSFAAFVNFLSKSGIGHRPAIVESAGGDLVTWKIYLIYVGIPAGESITYWVFLLTVFKNQYPCDP
jgi:hypothetical protein